MKGGDSLSGHSSLAGIFIYCCNYWTLFESAEHRAASRLQAAEREGQELEELDEEDEDEESSQQSELEQQSMLLTQVT